jgi:hypothetical protein
MSIGVLECCGFSSRQGVKKRERGAFRRETIKIAPYHAAKEPPGQLDETVG